MTPCSRCGDFLADGHRVQLWNRQEFCATCVERAGGSGFLRRMRADPGLIVQGRRDWRWQLGIGLGLGFLVTGFVLSGATGQYWVAPACTCAVLVVFQIESQRFELREGRLTIRTILWPTRSHEDPEVVAWQVLEGGGGYLQLRTRGRTRTHAIPNRTGREECADLRASLRLIAPEAERSPTGPRRR